MVEKIINYLAMVDEAKTEFPKMVEFLSLLIDLEISTPNDQEFGSSIRNLLHEYEKK